jgi:alpha-beta hydrolase superfamily lysophospholipase
MAPLLSWVFPRLRLVRTSTKRVSRDPRVVAQFETDPLVFHGRIPLRTGAEILRAIRQARAAMEHVTLPLLVLHGTGDRITDPEGSRRLHARAASDDKTLRLYDGLYHDVLHEPEHRQVKADLIEWLRART